MLFRSEAERFFGEALRLRPEAKITWVARAISRGQQNKTQEAAADFGYAASLYEQEGDSANAKELRQAAKQVSKPKEPPKGGNGIGSQILSSLSSLLPLAVQFECSPLMGQARVSTRIRLGDTQAVHALARMKDGSVWSASAELIVTLPACIEG